MSQQSSPQSAPFDHREYTFFIIFIAILGAFSSLVNDMYLPTIPDMMREFHTTPSMTQLGISATMIGLGIGSVLWGSLSDRHGRRPIMVISMAIFVVATAVSIFSTSIIFFIICRLFQGIGAGGSMVLSCSIPADRYTGRQLAVIMSVVGALNGSVPAAAPLIGGFMADDVGWRGIFVVLLVIGVGMLIWSTRRPESLPPSRRLQGKGFKPYINAYLSLLRNGRFMIYVLTKAAAIGLLYAYISSSPFILETHYGMSAAYFGILFAVNALFIVAGSATVTRFRQVKHALIFGGAIMSAGAIAAAVLIYHDLGIVAFECAVIPMLYGSGLVFSTTNALAMEEGRADAGSAGALLNVVKYIFAATVAPLVGLGYILHSAAWGYVATAGISAILMIIIVKLKPLPAM